MSDKKYELPLAVVKNPTELMKFGYSQGTIASMVSKAKKGKYSGKLRIVEIDDGEDDD